MTKHEPRRHHDGAIPGSAPSEYASSKDGFAPLHFDAREFLQYVEDENLTEAQALELLGVIWEIVVAFVDLGFGLSPIQHVVDRSRDPEGSSGSSSPSVLGSPSFSNKPKQETAGQIFAKAAAEDS